MSLNLKDIMKKAELKGIKPPEINRPQPILKPWQQESTLFNEDLNSPIKKSAKKTEHKPNTNLTQTEHETTHKSDTKWTQTKHTLKTGETQTKHKLDTQLNTLSNTKWTQTEHKLDTNETLFTIIGIQKEILLFIYESCKQSRSHISAPVTIENISKSLSIRAGSVKTSIARLENKRLIIRSAFKNGRGGWSTFEIPEITFKSLILEETRHKVDTNRQQTEYKLHTQPNTEVNTTLSSSSSSDLNNKKTATTTTEQQLPDEWERIDVEPLSRIGLSKSHIAQIYKKGILTAEIVQESIYAFAFDLDNNDKGLSIDKSPISFFLGIVLKNSFPYTKPDNYESPRDRAMRICIEEQTKARKKREAQEKELFDIAFSNWIDSISDDELKKQIPSLQNLPIKFKRESQFVLSAAREYFREALWLDELEKLLSEQIF